MGWEAAELTEPPIDNQDRFLELCERFAARGVRLRPGNFREDMIAHLLDCVEEQDVRLRGVEDKLLMLRKDLGDG